MYRVLERVHIRLTSQVPSKLKLDLAITGILAVGLLLRLWGVGFGLPRLYDPDEWHWVGRSLRMLHDRDPNPHWFGHPGTPLMYLLCVIYAAAYLAGLAVGRHGSAAEFEALYYRNPTFFYLSGRLLIVVLGVATIVALYHVARRVGGRGTGLLAAAVLAVSPTHVLYSKLIRGDVPMGFLLLVSSWFLLNVLQGGRWRDYLAAGLLTGLAVATKYTAAIFVVSIGLAHLEAIGWEVRDLQKHTKLLGCGLASLAGLFIGSPFVLLDLSTALSDIAYEARASHLGAVGEGYLQDLIWYLVGPVPNALTWLGTLLAAIGIVSFLGFRCRRERVIASAPILFMLFISGHSLRWERWIVPVIPLLCIPLAHAIKLVAHRAGQWLTEGLSPWVAAGLLFLVVVPLLWADIAQGQALTRPDTRTVAGEWMLANLPPGSRVLMESGTPQLPREAFVFFKVGRDGALERMNPQNEDHALFEADGSIGRIKHVGLLAQNQIQYLVLSNRFERYLAEEQRYPEIVAGYRGVIEDLELMYEIPGYTVERDYHCGGPTIRIYQVD